MASRIVPAARSLTDLYLSLATILWGSDYLIAKIALPKVSPLSFAAIRTLISTVALFPIFLRREQDWRTNPVMYGP